jgi:death-on-curing protein
VSQSESYWVWIDAQVLLAVHDEQLAEHGGGSGVRDAGLLDSALARPVNLAAYGEPDFADLAASYGFGLAKNHPFVDGNKRTAFVAVELFLALNGYQLQANDMDCVMTMLALAAGELEEADFAAWLRQNSADKPR